MLLDTCVHHAATAASVVLWALFVAGSLVLLPFLLLLVCDVAVFAACSVKTTLAVDMRASTVVASPMTPIKSPVQRPQGARATAAHGFLKALELLNRTRSHSHPRVVDKMLR